MALNAEYFDSIYIEVIKKKYYSAEKVQAVFAEIRRQAEELNAENESLRGELAKINSQKVELGEVLLSAQTVYQDILERAREKAEAITKEAEQRSAAILEDTRQQSEQILARSNQQEEITVRRVEKAFQRMKELHLASIDALNAQWQDFLCSLDPGADLEPQKTEAEPAPPREDAALPPDLEEKVGAIAEQLFSLEE